MSVQQKRKYDPEFKKNAVMLSEEPGRTIPEVAENLGIKNDLLYRWRRQLRRNGDIAFPGHGKMALTPDQKRIRDLEKELKDTEMERDILKNHRITALPPARVETFPV
jgi:transposase